MVQQRDQGVRRHNLSELPDDAGELRDHRRPARREPEADQPQHADERHRVAHADEHPSGNREADGVRDTEKQLTGRHHQRAGDHEPAGAEAVEHDTDRDLHGGVHRELQHREQRKDGGCGVESLLSLK